MLLCFDCHDEIDAKETREKWPVEKLMHLKELHEERIRYLTSLDASRTRVLVFQTAIQQSRDGEQSIRQSTIMHRSDLHDALLPEYFPDKSEPSRLRIDLPTNEDQFHWEQLRQTIRLKWERQDVDELEHLSIFCLAKMPAVAYFGRLVGNTRRVRIMNVQQGVATRWKSRDQVPEDFGYQVSRPDKVDRDITEVLLLISLSGVIEPRQYSQITPSNNATYRIQNHEDHLHPDWLVAEEQVKDFRKLYTQLLSEIQAKHGQDSTIHLLIAAPTPIVFEIGRQYRPNHHPRMKIYNCVNKRYEFAFSLGE